LREAFEVALEEMDVQEADEAALVTDSRSSSSEDSSGSSFSSAGGGFFAKFLVKVERVLGVA
jgi:hypothetical protein